MFFLLDFLSLRPFTIAVSFFLTPYLVSFHLFVIICLCTQSQFFSLSILSISLVSSSLSVVLPLFFGSTPHHLFFLFILSTFFFLQSLSLYPLSISLPISRFCVLIVSIILPLPSQFHYSRSLSLSEFPLSLFSSQFPRLNFSPPSPSLLLSPSSPFLTYGAPGTLCFLSLASLFGKEEWG